MESIVEIPMVSSCQKGIEFKMLLKGVLSGCALPVKKQNRPYVYEKFCEIIGEDSFKHSKKFWRETKSVFLKNRGNKPFIYFKNNCFILSEGALGEDISFKVSDDNELLFKKNPVVVDPLLLQRLFNNQQIVDNCGNDNLDDADEYAHYCISRELEKFQVQLLEKNMYRRN